MNRPTATRDQYMTALFANEIATEARYHRWEYRFLLLIAACALIVVSVFFPPLIIAAPWLPKTVRKMTPKSKPLW